METKTKIVKEFDTVKTFREIKDKISKDIKVMTFEQLEAYLDKTKLKPKTHRQSKPLPNWVLCKLGRRNNNDLFLILK